MLDAINPQPADPTQPVGLIPAIPVETEEQKAVPEQTHPATGVAPGDGLLLANWGNDDRAAALRLWLRHKIVTA